MENWVIDGINFKDLDAERYWTFPKSFKGDPKEETRNMIFSSNYLGARKMDGAYYRFIKDMNGNMRLQGRSKSVSGEYLDKLDHVPQLMDFFNWLPNGTCLLGEIYFPENEGSSNVTKIMGCLTDKAIARQNTGDKLCYYIFDVYAYGCASMLQDTIEDRVEAIYSIRDGWANSDVINDKNDYIHFAHYYEGKDLWTQLQWILANGGEGIVMTKKGTVPSPGKRTARKTLKVKKELQENIDCFFTGRGTPPTRLYSGKEIKTWKYWEDIRTGNKMEGALYEDYSNGAPIEPVTKPYFNGWVGSMEIAVLGKEANESGLPNSAGFVYHGHAVIPIGYLSGLADEIKADPRKYSMRCIEVAAMEVLPTGGIRHGKMMKFRPDLAPEDCTWTKAFN